MKEYTRDEVINKLAEYTYEDINWDGVIMTIEYGSKDYLNFTNQELIEEWKFLFKEDIKVKKIN